MYGTSSPIIINKIKKKKAKKRKLIKKNNNKNVGKLYICDIGGCNKYFHRKGQLRIHQFTHCKPFKCTHFQCQRSFGTKYDLKIHERTHSKEKKEICKFCGMKYHDPRNLKKHIKYVHESHVAQRPYVCRKCKKAFNRKDLLQIHYQTHLNPEDRKIFKCEKCDKSFTFKQNLSKHKRKFH